MKPLISVATAHGRHKVIGLEKLLTLLDRAAAAAATRNDATRLPQVYFYNLLSFQPDHGANHAVRHVGCRSCSSGVVHVCSDVITTTWPQLVRARWRPPLPTLRACGTVLPLCTVPRQQDNAATSGCRTGARNPRPLHTKADRLRPSQPCCRRTLSASAPRCPTRARPRSSFAARGQPPPVQVCSSARRSGS